MSKNIVLGVTGSIAAHKAADLASLLTKQGCELRVVMTADALHFITPLPFKTRPILVTQASFGFFAKALSISASVADVVKSNS